MRKPKKKQHHHLLSRDEVRVKYEARGWEVFTTQHDFPELAAVKAGKVIFIKVPRETPNMERLKQAQVIERLKLKGVTVDVIERPQKNPDHMGGRLVTSVSYAAKDIMFYERLLKILEIQGKSYNQWVNEQTFATVADVVKQAV